MTLGAKCLLFENYFFFSRKSFISNQSFLNLTCEQNKPGSNFAFLKKKLKHFFSFTNSIGSFSKNRNLLSLKTLFFPVIFQTVITWRISLAWITFITNINNLYIFFSFCEKEKKVCDVLSNLNITWLSWYISVLSSECWLFLCSCHFRN